MKLEEGKRYVTRSGMVTEPVANNGPDRGYPFIAFVPSEGINLTWKQDGSWWSGESVSANDIVKEYQESVKEEESDTETNNTGIRQFDTGSVRDSNAGKPRVADLEPYTRLRFGYHMLIGADKYGAKNYLLGQPDDSNFESIHRHLALLEMGDKTEDHASAVIFSVQNVILNQQKAGINANHFYEQHKSNANETK